ncbi:MAG: hypothetical protein J5I91_09255 [Bacteroidetes bacterium]|nr:hypothetical protein [Bacteroidota bacterium]
MKSIRKILYYQIIVVSTLFLLVSDIKAQNNQNHDNNIKVSYQLRPRLEFRDGAFSPANKSGEPAVLISQRDRLSIEYQHKDLLTILVSPQSVSIWGQGNMVQSPENSGNQFSLFESWAQLKLSEYWNVKFGRQVISLDDERFFGVLDWAQGARAHDALSFSFLKNKYELKGFFAYNQNYRANYNNNLNNPSGNLYSIAGALPYKTMQTLWANIPLNETMKITMLANNLGIQNYIAPPSSKTKFIQTYGVNYFINNKKLSFQTAVYYQMGEKLAAVMASINADYFINSNWSLGLGSDFLSGNDIGSVSSENNAFNPYFHTGHKFYGSMDYFYVGNGHNGVGLSDNYVRINYKSKKNYSVNLTIHQFTTPNKVNILNVNYEPNLGQELDLGFTYNINKFATLLGGYSFFLNTSTLNMLKNKPNAKDFQQWGWLSININPTIFKTNF